MASPAASRARGPASSGPRETQHGDDAVVAVCQSVKELAHTATTVNAQTSRGPAGHGIRVLFGDRAVYAHRRPSVDESTKGLAAPSVAADRGQLSFSPGRGAQTIIRQHLIACRKHLTSWS